MAELNLDLDELFGPEDPEPSQGPKALRSAFKKLQRELAEAKSENVTLRGQLSQRTVSELVKSKGLPEKVAALYKGDPTEEAFAEWLEQYADVLPVKPVEGEGQEQKVPDPVAEAFRVMQGVTQNAPAQPPDAAIESKIRSATSIDEMLTIANGALRR